MITFVDIMFCFVAAFLLLGEDCCLGIKCRVCLAYDGFYSIGFVVWFMMLEED